MALRRYAKRIFMDKQGCSFKSKKAESVRSLLGYNSCWSFGECIRHKDRKTLWALWVAGYGLFLRELYSKSQVSRGLRSWCNVFHNGKLRSTQGSLSILWFQFNLQKYNKGTSVANEISTWVSKWIREY